MKPARIFVHVLAVPVFTVNLSLLQIIQTIGNLISSMLRLLGSLAGVLNMGHNTVFTNTAVRGVHWEGAKITKHALDHGAVFALNLQISMDKPFSGEATDELFRADGLSETRLPGFVEDVYRSGLEQAFQTVTQTCRDHDTPTLVVQIARGRSAEPMRKEYIDRLLPFDEMKVIVKQGYREKTWFILDHASRFVFVNVGMFARLTDGVPPGVVFECRVGHAVKPMETDSMHPQAERFKVVGTVSYPSPSDMQSVHPQTGLPLVELLGLRDDMDFVLPTKYEERELMDLFPTNHNRKDEDECALKEIDADWAARRLGS